MSSKTTLSDPMKLDESEVKSTAQDTSTTSSGDGEIQAKKDWRFWMILVALSVTGLLSAMEATVTSTALPTIVHNLNIGNNYSWVANVYFLTR